VLPPAEATYNVGALLARQGRFEEARTYLHRALTLDTNLQQARLVLTRLDGAPEGNSTLAISTAPQPHP
jgi:Tfp pilus assembly protein PilF